MNRLLKIARSATPGTGVQFRKEKYGSSGIRGFLRDVLAMANAAVDGQRVGIFEIGDSQDRPYMMRIDYSENLRRGDAYVRVKNGAMKMGRRQLAELFERKFRDSVSAGDIEIGFPGEIIHKDLSVNVCDLTQLPSAEASIKLHQLIDIRNSSRNTGSTTVMARLTHARLFESRADGCLQPR